MTCEEFDELLASSDADTLCSYRCAIDARVAELRREDRQALAEHVREEMAGKWVAVYEGECRKEYLHVVEVADNGVSVVLKGPTVTVFASDGHYEVTVYSGGSMAYSGLGKDAVRTELQVSSLVAEARALQDITAAAERKG